MNIKLNLKKAFVILICVTVALGAFSGCTDTEQAVTELNIAIDNTNAYREYTATFFMSITSEEEDEATMFAQGEVALDKTDALKMSGVMTQYALGSTAAVNIYFEDGKYYTEIPDENLKTYSEIPEDTIKDQFIFADAVKFDADDIKKMKVTVEEDKTTYSFTAKADAELFSKLLGENVYVFSGAGNPDYDKTEYKDAECVFIVDTSGDEPLLYSTNITFGISVYNKMPYVPGADYDEDDFRFDLSTALRIMYKAYGSDSSVEKPDDLDEYVPESEVNLTEEDEE